MLKLFDKVVDSYDFLCYNIIRLKNWSRSIEEKYL